MSSFIIVVVSLAGFVFLRFGRTDGCLCFPTIFFGIVCITVTVEVYLVHGLGGFVLFYLHLILWVSGSVHYDCVTRISSVTVLSWSGAN